jgi:monofunctional biosynthetic peptidoglycan transglycosylase
MNLRTGLAWIGLLAAGAASLADEPMRDLFKFASPESAKEWQAVNDGVMGGVSDGRFKVSERNTLEFFGTLSLENNGGFASVRTRARKLGLQKGDVVVAKIRGDGREYSLNLYLNRPLIAFSYRAAVPTKKDEWVEVRVPLDSFEATSFGRVLRNAGAVKPDEVNAVGFMLSDKKPGSFKLEIDSIRVQRSTN